jgi:hypothetical protein
MDSTRTDLLTRFHPAHIGSVGFERQLSKYSAYEDSLMSELAAWRIEDVKGQCLDFVAGTLNAIKAAQSFANARDETIFIRRVWKGIEQRRAIEPVPEAEQPTL